MPSRAPIEADLADRRQLVGTKGRILDLELDDRLADDLRELTVVLTGLGLEEALHPKLIEAFHPSIDGPCGDTRLLGSLDRRRAKDHDRPNQLIALLLQPVELELELLPIIGGLEQGTFAAGHPRILPIPGGAIIVTGPS